VLPIQVFLIYLLAAAAFTSYIPGKEKNHWPYRLLFSFSDMLTVLAIVYIINFIVSGKCTMSTYLLCCAGFGASHLLYKGGNLHCFETSLYKDRRWASQIPRYECLIFVLLGIFFSIPNIHTFERRLSGNHPSRHQGEKRQCNIAPCVLLLRP
jgi:hypothetical protein